MYASISRARRGRKRDTPSPQRRRRRVEHQTVVGCTDSDILAGISKHRDDRFRLGRVDGFLEGFVLDIASFGDVGDLRQRAFVPLVAGGGCDFEGIGLGDGGVFAELDGVVDLQFAGHRAALQRQANGTLIAAAGNLDVAVDDAVALDGDGDTIVVGVTADVEGERAVAVALCAASVDRGVFDHDVTVVVGHGVDGFVRRRRSAPRMDAPL